MKKRAISLLLVLMMLLSLIPPMAFADDQTQAVLGTQTVNISAGENVQLTFTPDHDGVYLFSTQGTYDTYRELYDPDYNYLQSNEGEGTNNYSLRQRMRGGQDYYLNIQFWNDSQSGSVELTVEEVQIPASGNWGENLTWALSDDGTLTISGTGNMEWDNITQDIADRIKHVVIEDGVTSIADSAFFQCSNLQSVDIPDSVTRIGQMAFYECFNISEIELPDSITYIDEAAFAGCTLTIPNLPENLTYIGHEAFTCCTFTSSLTIPASVTYIGGGAFRLCNTLKAFSVETGNACYSSVDGVLFDENQKTLVQYPCGRRGSYTIPDGVTEIGSSAFEGANRLTGVSIPDSVTSIGGWAFESCVRLTSVTISNSVTYIPSYAFSFCDLRSVTIPDSVTEMGGAFTYNENLVQVSISDKVLSAIDVGYAFENTFWYDHIYGKKMDTVTLGETEISANWDNWTFYTFTPTKSGAYTFTTLDDPGIRGRLLDSETGELPCGDAVMEDCNFSYSYDLTAGRTYYIGVLLAWDEAKTVTLSIREHTHISSNNFGYDEEYHWIACDACGQPVEAKELHTYEDGYCTVCNVIDPDHEHIPGNYIEHWDEIDVSDGHIRTCKICEMWMTGIKEHHFDGNYCTECGTVDPNHEHVFGRWDNDWSWDEEKGESVNVGHYKVCELCYRQMSDVEAHHFVNNYCTECGTVDPNHEHVFDRWRPAWKWDDEINDSVSVGHYKACELCYRQMSDVEAHHFVNNYCTECGAADPNHEHVAGVWCDYGQWEGVYRISYGHRLDCAICGAWISDTEPHSYSNNICTVCHAVDPNHQHEAGDWYTPMQGGHSRECWLCSEPFGEVLPHTYEHDRCTDCGIESPNHECVYKYFSGYTTHYKVCMICGSGLAERPHDFDANNRCTTCGYMKDTGAIQALAIRLNKDGQIVITQTNTDGTTLDMTVTGYEFRKGDGMPGGWSVEAGNIYTDQGVLGSNYYFARNNDGRFYVCYRPFTAYPVQSNILDSCPWVNVYPMAKGNGIVNPVCVYSKNVWTVTGQAFDGENAKMTMDDEYCVLSYTVGVAPEAPVISTDYLTSSGKPYIKWNAVNGAAQYEVYRSGSSNGTYTLLGTTSNLNYADTSANAGYIYYYKVVAVSSGNMKSDYSAAVAGICHCAAPAATAAYLSSSGKPYIKWNAIDGAGEYEVYRSGSSNGTYTSLGKTNGLNYTDSTASTGYTYYYKVKALNSISTRANSYFSAAVAGVSHCPAPVVKTDYLASTGKPYIKWDAVTGAEKYEVYRSDSSTGSYKLLGTTANLNYTDTSAEIGSTYYYKVKAISSISTKANSYYSAAVAGVCHCAAPVVKFTTYSGHPSLSWNGVTGAGKYEIYRSTDGKNYIKYSEVTSTSYINSSATAGTTYYYKVKAICSSGTNANSYYSTAVSIKAK